MQDLVAQFQGYGASVSRIDRSCGTSLVNLYDFDSWIVHWDILCRYNFCLLVNPFPRRQWRLRTKFMCQLRNCCSWRPERFIIRLIYQGIARQWQISTVVVCTLRMWACFTIVRKSARHSSVLVAATQFSVRFACDLFSVTFWESKLHLEYFLKRKTTNRQSTSAV